LGEGCWWDDVITIEARVYLEREMGFWERGNKKKKKKKVMKKVTVMLAT